MKINKIFEESNLIDQFSCVLPQKTDKNDKNSPTLFILIEKAVKDYETTIEYKKQYIGEGKVRKITLEDSDTRMIQETIDNLKILLEKGKNEDLQPYRYLIEKIVDPFSELNSERRQNLSDLAHRFSRK